MKFIDFLFILSIYLIITVIISLIYYYGFKVKILGNYWALFFAAFIGTILGGVFFTLGEGFFIFFTKLNNYVNIYPPLITSYIFVKIYLAAFKKR